MRSLARCTTGSRLILLVVLLMSAPALAGPVTWRDGLETVRLIDERAGRVAVIVVGAGAQRGLADATRAVRDAYTASGAIRPMSRADMETAVTSQVLQRYPWLTRLAEHRSIARKFARLTLAERAARRLSDRRRARREFSRKCRGGRAM